MDVALGVIDRSGRAVLVHDVITIDQVAPGAQAFSGEVAADVVDAPDMFRPRS